jgi:hypothetical protein
LATKNSPVQLSTADKDLGVVPANKALTSARELANELKQPVTVRHPVSDKVIKTVKPTKAKRPVKAAPKGAAKVSKAKAPKAKVAKTREPRGMVVQILKLASRPTGVSPAELNKLTNWKGAPWKWLFSNPKKNGYCDRWNYKFKVIEGPEGETRYSVTAK